MSNHIAKNSAWNPAMIEKKQLRALIDGIEPVTPHFQNIRTPSGTDASSNTNAIA